MVQLLINLEITVDIYIINDKIYGIDGRPDNFYYL